MELLDGMQNWFNITLDLLYEQWVSDDYDDYDKLSDCPVYKEAVTFRDAINFYIDANFIDPSDDIKLGSIKEELNIRIKAKKRNNIKRMFE